MQTPKREFWNNAEPDDYLTRGGYRRTPAQKHGALYGGGRSCASEARACSSSSSICCSRMAIKAAISARFSSFGARRSGFGTISSAHHHAGHIARYSFRGERDPAPEQGVRSRDDFVTSKRFVQNSPGLCRPLPARDSSLVAVWAIRRVRLPVWTADHDGVLPLSPHLHGRATRPHVNRVAIWPAAQPIHT